MKTLSAHQPHFFPWLGYLEKILRADVFVFVDHVQFERQNFQNRNRVKSRAGPQWIRVPVHQRSRDERIVEKRINNARDGRITWGEKVVRALHHNYKRAPYYRMYRGRLEAILCRHWDFLVDLDEALLSFFLAAFEIETPVVRSSQLEGIRGAKSEMIVSMCRAVGADSYLSGSGGSRRYLDLDLFADSGIGVLWQSFEHPRYPQLSPPREFIPRLSAVDLLFNCGPRSGAILREGQPAPEMAIMPRAARAAVGG